MTSSTRPTAARRTTSWLVCGFAAFVALAACSSDDGNAVETTPSVTIDEPTGETSGSTLDSAAVTTTTAAPGVTGVADLGQARQAIVDLTISQAADAGFEFDRECVVDVVDQLPASDVAVLAAALASDSGEGVTLSAEGEALADALFDCVVGSDDTAKQQAVYDLVLGESGDLIDEECLRRTVEQFSDAQLDAILEIGTDATNPLSSIPAVQNAGALLLDCYDFDGATVVTGG